MFTMLKLIYVNNFDDINSLQTVLTEGWKLCGRIGRAVVSMCDGLALSRDTSLFRFVFEMEFYLDDLLFLCCL